MPVGAINKSLHTIWQADIPAENVTQTIRIWLEKERSFSRILARSNRAYRRATRAIATSHRGKYYIKFQCPASARTNWLPYFCKTLLPNYWKFSFPQLIMNRTILLENSLLPERCWVLDTSQMYTIYDYTVNLASRSIGYSDIDRGVVTGLTRVESVNKKEFLASFKRGKKSNDTVHLAESADGESTIDSVVD